MTPQQRLIAFLVGCIGIRLWFVYLAKTVSPEYLQIMGWLALLPAMGFIYLYTTDSRQTGAEAGGRIWWNSLRPVHGCLYLSFALLAIKQDMDFAWMPLALDVSIGLLAWMKNKNII